MNKIVGLLSCEIDVNSLDPETDVTTMTYIAGLLKDYTFGTFLCYLGIKATAYCIFNNLGLPRFNPTPFPLFEPGVLNSLDSNAYALIALKLINKNASPDCNAHVRDKLIDCIQQWIAEQKYKVQS